MNIPCRTHFQNNGNPRIIRSFCTQETRFKIFSFMYDDCVPDPGRIQNIIIYSAESKSSAKITISPGHRICQHHFVRQLSPISLSLQRNSVKVQTNSPSQSLSATKKFSHSAQMRRKNQNRGCPLCGQPEKEHITRPWSRFIQYLFPGLRIRFNSRF